MSPRRRVPTVAPTLRLYVCVVLVPMPATIRCLLVPSFPVADENCICAPRSDRHAQRNDAPALQTALCRTHCNGHGILAASRLAALKTRTTLLPCPWPAEVVPSTSSPRRRRLGAHSLATAAAVVKPTTPTPSPRTPRSPRPPPQPRSPLPLCPAPPSLLSSRTRSMQSGMLLP